MRILSAAAVMVLLTAPAYAQMPNVNLMPEIAVQDSGGEGAGCDQGQGLQGIAEEDSRRQDLFRSVGRRAQQ